MLILNFSKNDNNLILSSKILKVNKDLELLSDNWSKDNN